MYCSLLVVLLLLGIKSRFLVMGLRKIRNGLYSRITPVLFQYEETINRRVFYNLVSVACKADDKIPISCGLAGSYIHQLMCPLIKEIYCHLRDLNDMTTTLSLVPSMQLLLLAISCAGEPDKGLRNTRCGLCFRETRVLY